MTKRNPPDGASTPGSPEPVSERSEETADHLDDEDQPYLARPVDAAAMKAFAHPLRMQMYAYLTDHGSATATMLAKHTGESTGQTSYHLRQLERHGFVIEDEGRGTGRERWWKAAGFNMRGALSEDPSLRPAIAMALETQLEQRYRNQRSWYERSVGPDRHWLESTVNSTVTVEMNREESERMAHAVMTLIHEHTEQAKARRAAGDTKDVRRVRIYFDVFPLPEAD
jgi:DNA-binding transcriptional ArsR family regulator